MKEKEESMALGFSTAASATRKPSANSSIHLEKMNSIKKKNWGLHHTACVILVPQSMIEPTIPCIVTAES